MACSCLTTLLWDYSHPILLLFVSRENILINCLIFVEFPPHKLCHHHPRDCHHHKAMTKKQSLKDAGCWAHVVWIKKVLPCPAQRAQAGHFCWAGHNFCLDNNVTKEGQRQHQVTQKLLF